MKTIFSIFHFSCVIPPLLTHCYLTNYPKTQKLKQQMFNSSQFLWSRILAFFIWVPVFRVSHKALFKYGYELWSSQDLTGQTSAVKLTDMAVGKLWRSISKVIHISVHSTRALLPVSWRDLILMSGPLYRTTHDKAAGIPQSKMKRDRQRQETEKEVFL